MLLLVAPPAHAQFAGGLGARPGDATAKTEASAGTSVVQRWKMGFSIRAVNANCAGIFATFPVPTDWPEQTAQIVEELSDVSPQVTKVQFRVLGGGVKQVLVTIPILRSGEEAHVYMTYDVTKRIVVAPEDVTMLKIPQRLPREFRRYLGKSPYIETTSPRIKVVAKKVVAGKDGAWDKVEAIYDWVREHVEYKEGKLKGALAALKDGDGDCEELTSLFVAMCRANRIPARVVWIQGHCYPEFYLQDDQGDGQWYPCQAAGTRSFGGMFDKRLIIQKGDTFKVPEKKAPQRYVAEFLSAKSVRGSGGPQVTWVRKLSLEEAPVARFP